MALTIQMGLNGPQQVKERALHNIRTSKSARGDMKQVLQSRAEIYGDELDPKWSELCPSFKMWELGHDGTEDPKYQWRVPGKVEKSLQPNQPSGGRGVKKVEN